MPTGDDAEPNKQPNDQTSGSERSDPNTSSIPETVPTSLPPSPDQPNPSWQYTADETSPEEDLRPVSWSASEYIDHQKSASWFLAVAGVALLISGIVFLITRDAINSIVIIIVAGLFAVLGARRPQILDYGLDNRGIHIGNRHFDYNSFKSFAIMEEDAISSIQLFQFKRFSTPISLYFPPEQEDEIVSFLGNYLPHETRKLDHIDRLMRKVRF